MIHGLGGKWKVHPQTLSKQTKTLKHSHSSSLKQLIPHWISFNKIALKDWSILRLKQLCIKLTFNFAQSIASNSYIQLWKKPPFNFNHGPPIYLQHLVLNKSRWDGECGVYLDVSMVCPSLPFFHRLFTSFPFPFLNNNWINQNDLNTSTCIYINH